MMMRIAILFCSLLFFCPMLFGQAVTLHEMMDRCKVEQKGELIELWQNYVRAAQMNEPTERYWAEGSFDIIPHVFQDFYQNFDQELVDIQYRDGVFRLLVDAKHISEKRIGTTQGVYYIICAVATDDGYRLKSYFDSYKSSFEHIATEHIDFYGSGRPMSLEECMLSEKFLSAFEQQYGIKMAKRLTYIYNPSVKMAMNNIGILKIYDGTTNGSSTGALYIKPIHSIFANNTFHFHELVHAVMMPTAKSQLMLLHEGIATYAGTSSERYNKEYVQKCAEWLKKHPIDFSTLEPLHSTHYKNNATVLYAVGAKLIEYTFEHKGADGVRTLFELESYDDIFNYLGVVPSERTAFIYGLFDVEYGESSKR